MRGQSTPSDGRFRAVIAAMSCLLMAQGGPAPETVAQRFLGSLDKSQRSEAVIALGSEERFNWHYVPKSRKGIPRGRLSGPQRDRFDSLLRTGLSESGFRKALGVIELEDIIRRDPGNYFVTLFGKPAASPWGWRFEGHHLSLNFTLGGGEIAATPMFFGANPARVPGGTRAGWRLLQEEEDLARQLLHALTPFQYEQAVIDGRAPSDIVTGADREVKLQKFEGLPASEMNPSQRALLMRLIRTYMANAIAGVEAREMAALQHSGMERLYFAWAGGRDAGQPHYYRIHGPSILIEYDNTQGGANHIHTVWRTPGRDFGQDLLRKHYAEADHHRPSRKSKESPKTMRSR